MNAQNLFAMGQQMGTQQNYSQPVYGQQPGGGQAAPQKVKPAEDGWICACGSVNKGKFCPNCGAKKPAAAPLYRCDKCGWEPEDPGNPPKFCPECGDPFTDSDIR